MSAETEGGSPVAQDAHALERLREVAVDEHGGQHGRCFDTEGDGISIVVHVEDGADAGEVHERLAAVFQTADDLAILSHPDSGGTQ